jgi:hypothetical protein
MCFFPFFCFSKPLFGSAFCLYQGHKLLPGKDRLQFRTHSLGLALSCIFVADERQRLDRTPLSIISFLLNFASANPASIVSILPKPAVAFFSWSLKSTTTSAHGIFVVKTHVSSPMGFVLISVPRFRGTKSMIAPASSTRETIWTDTKGSSTLNLRPGSGHSDKLSMTLVSSS